MRMFHKEYSKCTKALGKKPQRNRVLQFDQGRQKVECVRNFLCEENNSCEGKLLMFSKCVSTHTFRISIF
jgi:hypothetical protein